MNAMNAFQIFLVKNTENGFMTAAQVEELVKLHRLCPCLVRCGCCRFICAAQDVRYLSRAIHVVGDYVRDVCVTTTEIKNAPQWRPEPEPGRQTGQASPPPPAAAQVAAWEQSVKDNPPKRVEISDRVMFNEGDCGGVWDGFSVHSDADPGL